MSALIKQLPPSDGTPTHFEAIAQALTRQGYCIIPDALISEPELTQALFLQACQMPDKAFSAAGIGRQKDHMQNNFVRRDEIHWIDGKTPAEQAWLDWNYRLQHFLNRRLFLGLFSYESHFAHYRPGAFYKKHMDAFRGEANRVLTTVFYLNPSWTTEDGGELVLYPEHDPDNQNAQLAKVMPTFGTMVIFLSEEFPHEVLPAMRDRYSIAGWFRVNNTEKLDPPR
ncbi:2OG-Fe(II) oxygenase [Motilimonas cestriensis]|uniref:2OG-Fe(II) oxygenase n=1 Tax=Motilimonas cestriensis TaxID=2742685 RepID=A0ABS8WAZ5_9GAMM|nr:2OG-Fe(II) oxygenase [Motilimonas cestriensis]MCE2596206.1 2OG-Fe(II) oxygenase [Motilimonas cestriensis]